MVAEYRVSSRVVAEVARVYRWLDRQLSRAPEAAGTCDLCGRCCDFDAFDHLLFVASPELMHLAANVPGEKLKPMAVGRCPYNIAGECTVYEHRFAGCRIFCCKGDRDFQSRLSESALKRLMSICEECGLPYTYKDLATALNGLART